MYVHDTNKMYIYAVQKNTWLTIIYLFFFRSSESTSSESLMILPHLPSCYSKFKKTIYNNFNILETEMVSLIFTILWSQWL